MRKSEIAGKIRELEGRLAAKLLSPEESAELLRRSQGKHYPLKTEVPTREVKGWRGLVSWDQPNGPTPKGTGVCGGVSEKVKLEHKLAELQRKLAALGK